MKKVVVLIAISLTTFGCNKSISKPPVTQQKTYSINSADSDTIPVPKKKGVCEGCSHQ